MTLIFSVSLCHTQIQGCTSFLLWRDVLSRFARGSLGPCSYSGTPRLKTADWRLTTADSFYCELLSPTSERRPVVTFHDWLNLFWQQDWDWPLLCGYLCIYNFITLTHFQFNPCELLIPTHRCLPVYTGTSGNLFVNTVGTSSSVKGQYETEERIRKSMTMHPRDYIVRFYVLRKDWGKILHSIVGCVDATIKGIEKLKKSKERLIAAVSNNNVIIRINCKAL